MPSRRRLRRGRRGRVVGAHLLANHLESLEHLTGRAERRDALRLVCLLVHHHHHNTRHPTNTGSEAGQGGMRQPLRYYRRHFLSNGPMCPKVRCSAHLTKHHRHHCAGRLDEPIGHDQHEAHGDPGPRKVRRRHRTPVVAVVHVTLRGTAELIEERDIGAAAVQGVQLGGSKVDRIGIVRV